MKNKRIDYLDRYIDKSFLVFMSLNFLILHFFIVLVTIIKCINFGCIIWAPATMLVKIRH